MATNVIPVENITGFKWGSLVLLGVLSLIFGLLVVLFPAISAAVLVELLGILILLLSFAARHALCILIGAAGKIHCFLAVLGIIGFFFGIATIIHPIIMGLVIFFDRWDCPFPGRSYRALCSAVGETHRTHRGLFALQGILAIIIGLFICVRP